MITAKRTIFNYYNDDWGSIKGYKTGVVKLLIEDEDFFKAHINMIDPNTFVEEYWKMIIGTMKDVYNMEGLHLDVDMLLLRLERRAHNEIELEEFAAALEECKNLPMPAERKRQIEAEIKYHNLFYGFAKATNHAKDTLYGDYITSMPQLKAAAKRLVEDAEKVKKYLDDLDETDGGKGNDW